MLRRFESGDWFDRDAPRPGVRVEPSGRLGITVTPLSDQLAAYFGAKGGVLVSSVVPDSPAAAAGLKAGDVVTSINGRAVSAPGDVIEDVRRSRPGDALTLEVVRDRKASSFTVTLPERPARRNILRERPI
jgi:serine protease Do